MRKFYRIVLAYLIHDLTVLNSLRYRFQENKDRYYGLDCIDIQ